MPALALAPPPRADLIPPPAVVKHALDLAEAEARQLRRLLHLSLKREQELYDLARAARQQEGPARG